jgi:hypothetical protein
MKYTIKQKGEKYFKKFLPFGAELIGWAVVAIAIIYIVFEVIRG